MSSPRGAAVLPANWWEASILSDSCSGVAESSLIFGFGRRANNAGGVFVKGGANPSIGRFDDKSRAFGFRKERSLEGVRSVIRLEGLGDVDGSVGGLMLLDESDEETGQGGAGSVEGVAEVVFTFGIFVAELHAARLIVAKTRAT